MPISSLVQFVTEKAVDFIAEQCGADKETRKSISNGAGFIAGMTTAIGTLDVAGGTLVAIKAGVQASGEKMPPAIGIGMTAMNLIAGNIDPSDLSTTAEAASTSVSTATDYWAATH